MFGWAASAVVSIGIMYALIPFLDEETAPEIDLTFRVLYGTFHRLLWGAAVGWVIVACAHGYGGGRMNNLLLLCTPGVNLFDGILKALRIASFHGRLLCLSGG